MIEEFVTHDFVLVFSKTWGGLYLAAVFFAALIWTYWPSRKKTYDRAALSPLTDEEIQTPPTLGGN